MTTSNNWVYPDTNGWAEFPFSLYGFNFVSKLDKNGWIYPRVISRMTADQFAELNMSAIVELAGMRFTRSEIVSALETMNRGASEAVIELV